MNLRQWLKTYTLDLRANSGYPKSQAVLFGLRSAQYLKSKSNPLARIAYILVGGFYKLSSEWILGIEIPVSTQIGPGLRIRHGVGIVLSPHAVLGRNVLLRQGVTIGNRRTLTDCPIVGDDVEIGASASLIGPIVIGTRARIGAGVVLIEDMPDYAVAYTTGVVVKAGRAALQADEPVSKKGALGSTAPSPDAI